MYLKWEGKMDKNYEQLKQDQPQNKKNKKKWLIVFLIVLLIAAFGAIYWWSSSKLKQLEKQKNDQISQLEQDKKTLEQQLAEEKAKTEAGTNDQAACTSPTTKDIDNIKAAITSGNTAALEGYMSSKVRVIIAASEGVGDRTPTQAVGDITSYIQGASSWDFDLSESTLGTYRGGFYAQYFPEGAVVGKANNKKIISISFDCKGKVKTVFLAIHSDLLQ
jgi:hypothetical protein